MTASSALEEIFFAALEKPTAAERAAYLDAACGGDAALRRQVERLLAAEADAGSFLEAPAAGIERSVAPPPVAEGPGATIGRYKLLEEIGDGGMGVVYMAEQREPVRRKVALKIVKPGMDTREVIARFEAERQALAMMDHPNIAKVFDAGETESGRSYFVMELVHGVPLTEYCDRNELTIRERLELFVQVCQTVQHAHQKGIIHRDIKPSNVMIAQCDGAAAPKIIDFGIAKAMHGPLTERTFFTHFGQMIGTPLYMSPEQAELRDADVDTRSDIYSLGVVLYELLTGSTPCVREQVEKAGFDEIRRMIREDEPQPPSTRISTLDAATSTIISAHRKTRPEALGGLLRGDLDWIVLKALEKDRARRYETAADFARDVRHYLAGEPIEARPPRFGDRLGRWCRRRRSILTSAAVFLLGAAIAGVWLGIVMQISTGEGAVKLEFSDAAAAQRCSVSVDGNDIRIENLGAPIKLRAGRHKLNIRQGDIEIETREFDVVQNGAEVLHVSIPADPSETAAAPKNSRAAPRDRTALPWSEVPAQQNPLLPKIVFGEWMPLLPPPGKILGWDRSKGRIRYSDRALEERGEDWFPLLDLPDQLVGWDYPWGDIDYSNRTIDKRNGSGGVSYGIVAKDVSIRARTKKLDGQRISFGLRLSDKGGYSAWFNGSRRFGIGKNVGENWTEIAIADTPESYDDFFDFQFTAVGDALMLFVNDKLVVEAHDSSLAAGGVAVGGLGGGLFRDVEIKIPSVASLLGDDRQLHGRFPDPRAMDDLCTRLLRKAPSNSALYKQRADLRARYQQKWRQAADDLSRAIELDPDDFSSWTRRTALLLKLRQADMLADHMKIMLAAPFRDNPPVWQKRDIIICLTAAPNASPNIFQVGQQYADQLRSDPESWFTFPAGFMRYRAGRYEEAEKLFCTAESQADAESFFAKRGGYVRAACEAFHAMNKARLNDLDKARELLSKAKAAFQQELLGRKLAASDYGDQWWGRLGAEALLAEAENLCAGAGSKDGKLPPGAQASAPKGVPAQQNPLLPRIVFGEWMPLLPPAGKILGWDRRMGQVRYSTPLAENRDNDWVPLLTTPDQLVGWGREPWSVHVRYSDRTIRTLVGAAISYEIVAKDVSIRAKAKKLFGKNLTLGLRMSDNGYYAAWFDGGRQFGIGKAADGKWTNLAAAHAPDSCDDFFDFQFTAVDDKLMLFVNGKLVVEARDRSHNAGHVDVGGLGSGLFKDVEIKIPTAASLAADNRELRGPFAHVRAMEGIYTQLLTTAPNDPALYKRRAELRARYLQKWSGAAQDLANVNELAPDDFMSWHRRTMLLVKLKRKDLLAEHLTRMLGKFKDKPEFRAGLFHSLMTCPTEPPELARAIQLLADQQSKDPESSFWTAFPRYRAGQYQEAEELFSSAEAELSVFGPGYRTQIYLAFHAMIEFKLNARDKARELLAQARKEFKKEILDDGGEEQGDYGIHWWDRLSAEAVLAEAENLIAGAKR